MARVNIQEYISLDAYEKNNFIDTIFNITILDLTRQAITLGGFSQHPISNTGIEFYEKLIGMAILEDRNKIRIRDDYNCAEQSIKTSISFFIGMIMTCEIAEKKYKISPLYHLKDSRLNIKAKKSPDFFGIHTDKNNIKHAYLFEAKGTTYKKPSNRTIDRGIKQLESVNEVITTDDNKTYNKFKKHVIGVGFDQKSKDMIVYDIDPENSSNAKIFLNKNKAIFLHYENIMRFLLNEMKFEKLNKIEIEGSHYITAQVGKFELGLDDRIFKILNKYSYLYNMDEYEKDIDEELSNLYKSIDNLEENKNNKPYKDNEKHSIGADGVILAEN